jgi:hypothetical protein
MRIDLKLNYNDLAHLAPLFAALYERYPTGWMHFELEPSTRNPEEQEPRLVLDVQPHTLNQDDREFLDSLRDRHLISLWLRSLADYE